MSERTTDVRRILNRAQETLELTFAALKPSENLMRCLQWPIPGLAYGIGRFRINSQGSLMYCTKHRSL